MQINDSMVIYFRFLNPIGDGEWLVLGGRKDKSDWKFVGIVVFKNARLCTFKFNELKKKKLPFGFQIEFDKNFTPQTWGEFRRSVHF